MTEFLESGGKFLEYDLIKRLGSGSFGEVWLAKTSDGTQVALKIFRYNTDVESGVDLFKQEFSFLSELRHANLSRVFDYGSCPDKGLYYFTEEYCPGQNFMESVKGRPIAYFEKALVQVLSALDYIHSMGVAHFDIKPENIIIDDRLGEPYVKILDFGVAVKLKVFPKIIGGTPIYMAPELITRSKSLDHRVDLYSLGMLCLRTLTDRLPFDATNVAAIMRWHVEGSFNQAIWEGRDVPKYLKEIVEKLLKKNPTERFSNARVVLSFLNIATAQKYKKIEEHLQDKIPTVGPLVGRDDVMDSLKRIFNDAYTCALPAVVFISGERGIGKSRILDEVRSLIELRDISFFHTVCNYETLVWPRFSEWLNQKPSVPSESKNDWIAKLRADAVLHRSKSKPICVLIDDFHKADVDMKAFINELALATKRIASVHERAKLFVIVATEEEKDGMLFLNRLEAKDISRYIELVLGPIERMETTVDILQKYSGGLPILVVEGLAFMAPHIFHGRPLENLLPPPQIGLLYGEKIRSLDTFGKEFILTVALLFRPAKGRLLANIFNVPIAQIVKYAEICRRYNLVKEEPIAADEGGVYCVSSQALALDLITNSDAADKKLAHMKIALALEKDSEVAPSEIAYHMAKCGEDEKAVVYFRKAGEEAKKSGQLANAADFLSKAVDLTDKKGHLWQRHVEEVAQLLTLAGDFKKASDYLATILEPPSPRVLELMGNLSLKQRHFEAAKKYYEGALRLIPKSNIRDIILIENSIANVDLQMGMTQNARDKFRTTLEMEKSLGEEDSVSIDNNNLGIALAMDGNVSESINFYRERLAKCPSDNELDRLNLLSGLGYVLMQGSMFKEAIETFEEAHRLADATQATHASFSILGNLMTAYLKEARYVDGLHISKELLSLEKRFGVIRDVAFAWLRQQSIYLILGMEEAAHECFLNGIQKCKEMGGTELIGWFNLMEGYREREFGNAETAKKYYYAAEDYAKKTNDKNLTAWVFYSLADMAYDCDATQEAQEHLDKATWLTNDVEFETRKKLLSAKLVCKTNSKQKLEELFSPLLDICAKNHFHEIRWEVCHAWGMFEFESGNIKMARDLIKKGKTILDRIILLLPEEFHGRYMQHKGRSLLFHDWEKICMPKSEQSDEITIECSNGGANDSEKTSALPTIKK